MNPWGPYGIPAWMAIWVEILSPPIYATGRNAPDAASFYTDDEIEAGVSELREDLEALTPDDLTIGRRRSL